ncbi:hypothetical protein TWF481_001192 [Arthrobotrys musiformis]|uniref:F-box domain-containing protein n=1 Tax=Arthrobotrys musiformis TaxID=47236 RepID=A0AAV9WPU3_9PEZI
MPPLSHFQVLAPELVIQICSYLDNKDLPNLLPTCKYLHNAVSGYLHDEASKTILQVLSDARSDVFSFAGIEFSRTSPGREEEGGGDETKIELGRAGGSLMGSKPGFDVLIEALESLLREERKAVAISFRVDSQSLRPEYGNRNLLLSLKAFSHTRPASQFSINSLTADLQPDEVSRIFDVRKLTRLTISFPVRPWNRIPKYDSGVLDIESDEYRNGTLSQRQALREKAYEEYTSPDEGILDDISGLNKLLLRAGSLEYLQLNPLNLHYKKFRPLGSLPPILEEFKQTFKNLPRLRTLELDGFLFHVSFFVPVPDGLERLLLKNIQYYSKTWWIEFSKYKFGGLRELYIDYDPVFRQYSAYESDTALLHRDGSLKTQDEIQNGFKLDSVEVSTLEKFTYERTHSSLFGRHFCFPADLVPCIVKKNERLDPKTKRALANRHAEETVVRCRERLESVMESCRDAVKAELVGEFLEGRVEDDGLERCLASYVRYVLGKPRQNS